MDVDMDALPPDEQARVWQHTSVNFWNELKRQWKEEQDEADKKYNQERMDIHFDVASLSGRHGVLDKDHKELAAKVAELEAELSRIARERDSKTNRLNALEIEYREQQQLRLAKRERVREAMTEYFRKQCGEDVPIPDDHEEEYTVANAEKRDAAPSPSMNRSRTAPQHSPVLTNGHARDAPPQVLVNVVDADDRVIGPVERIQPWNQWVEAIQNVPVQRPVKIRRGRKFNLDHLSNIYERTEAKGVKWLSCMIQATGTRQRTRCVSCEKNQGAFEECIILGGDLFSKCGNCEWNRQGCHGASGETAASVPLAEEMSNGTEPQADEARQDQELRARRREAAESALAKAAGLDLGPAIETGPASQRSMTDNLSQEPEQLPTPSEPKEYSHSGGFTPANGRSRPPSLAPTPTNLSAETSPQPTDASYEEITRENLVLKHNGEVYTYPECVAGVPLAKIQEGHPYWDPLWPNVKSTIEPALRGWKTKNQAALEEEQKGEKRGSAKYQTGRQVNRGLKILEFLEEGPISPYQLLSKRYTQSGKGGITSYDTLFRLSDTLAELAKFKLDVTPVEWLRHRLHELITERGGDFNYSKIMHDFYNDEKLTALRIKNGFKSIGRPSGGKQPRHSLGSVMSTPQALSKKRKSTQSQTGTPRDTPSLDGSPLVAHALLPQDSPFGNPLPKRHKPIAPAEGGAVDEFYTADHSDTDSLCDSPLMTTDWRLYQVKTRLYTSSTSVTQYWTWQQHKRRFEHQVLTEIDPAQWGTLKEPINFNILLDEIAAIEWNIDALRIKVITRKNGSPVLAKKDGRPRGDVMAGFKRPQSMKRFLGFCRDLKVVLVKVALKDIEREWLEMESEHLPDRDEDASEELRQ
jgi:hypothetical protein